MWALTLLAYRHVGAVPFTYDDANWLPLHVGVTAIAWWPWAIAGWLGHDQASAYHALILGAHSLNGVLVYLILRRWLTESASVIATGLFWLAPLNTQAVSYLSGGIEVVLASWALLALWSGLQRTHRMIWWPVAAVCLVAAVLTKWSALPLILAIPAVWWIDGKRRALAFLALPLVCGLLLPAVWFWWQEVAELPVSAFGLFVARTCAAGWRYLFAAVCPVGLSLLHDWARVPSLWLGGAVAATGIALGLAWGCHRRAPAVTCAVGWIVLTLGPRAFVPQPQLLQEHHTYLPFLAVWGLVGWLVGGERGSYAGA